MDALMLYDILYALAARDGREQKLFGNCAPLAHEALARSLACDTFPELWFEMPLAGDPWFDLHALTERTSLEPGMAFDPETCGGAPEAFEWFAMQGEGPKQLALSWDVSSGSIDYPAVQLLELSHDVEVTCEFLAAAGRPDAQPSYRAFKERLPESWDACYAGVFPARPGHNLRVECIPDLGMRQAYANDVELLREHLRSIGVPSLNDELIYRCGVLAAAPFQIEFQFDVEPDGSPGPTLGVSVRFAHPTIPEDDKEPFAVDGAAGELMTQVESWGLADDRWRDLAGTVFAMNASLGEQSALLYCYPAFLKLRWRDGQPVDAKTYLIAGVQ